MKYMGSKNKYAKDILYSIQKEVPFTFSSCWVEPFVGGCNMIDKVPFDKRIGNDINYHLIKMFESMKLGWIPPENVSEKEYQDLKKKSVKDISAIESPLIGFVGIGCSYSGKWFGGYARGNDTKGNPRNYARETRDNLLKQIPFLKTVKFYSQDYRTLKLPENSIIYCDPPYEDTTKYKDYFDTNKFWLWCYEKAREGHKVFVSSYTAPSDWRCIWEKKVNSSLTKETGSKKATEKLFTFDL